MSDEIFLLNNDNNLIELRESEFITEDQFQQMLEEYPNLISGSQIDPDHPRKWILVSREVGIPSEEGGSNVWSIDHLFLDQDGIPTLVEVKRSTDTRIRREVVGQMLDYAANSVSYWSIDEIKHKYEQNCIDSSIDPDQLLTNLLGDDYDLDKYWEIVDTNLKAGKIRLLFIADKIPKELQRIIEFLNEQMTPAEVLGVEIKQYANNELRTLVPRVIGKTTSAQMKKNRQEYAQWTVESFMQEIERQKSKKYISLMNKILDFLKEKKARLWLGKGRIKGSIIPVFDLKKSVQLFGFWTEGYVEVYFTFLVDKPPFDNKSKRIELLNRINQISGVIIPDDKHDKRPAFDMEVLLDSKNLETFLGIFDWFINQFTEG